MNRIIDMNNNILFCSDFLVPRKIKPKLKHRKVAHLTFVRKVCSKNVGEIDIHLLTQFNLNYKCYRNTTAIVAEQQFGSTKQSASSSTRIILFRKRRRRSRWTTFRSGKQIRTVS